MHRVLIVTFASLAVALWPAATTATLPDRGAIQWARPAGVQRLVFSAVKYPNVRRHFRRAVLRRSWPLRLVVNRRGADERRERLLRDFPTPRALTATSTRLPWVAAAGRAWSVGATRGWKADVRHVRSSENRSHVASLGAQLEPFCNGTRFR